MLHKSQLTVSGLCITHLHLGLQLHSMAIISTHWEKLLGFTSVLGNAIHELHFVRGYNLDGRFRACYRFHGRQTSIMSCVSKSKALFASDQRGYAMHSAARRCCSKPHGHV